VDVSSVVVVNAKIVVKAKIVAIDNILNLDTLEKAPKRCFFLDTTETSSV
jgi:hypothetical protein